MEKIATYMCTSSRLRKGGFTYGNKAKKQSSATARNMLQVFAAAVIATLAMTGRSVETTSDMAIAAAEAWSAENGLLVGRCGTPVSAKERRDDSGRLLWFEVAMSGGGCVVTSPDTEIEPIVAVIDSYEGEIPQDHPLEAMLLADMSQRLDVLGRKAVSTWAAASGGTSSAYAATYTASATGVKASAAEASRKWARLTGGVVESAKARLLMATAADPTPEPDTVVKYLPEWASGRLTYWNQFSTYTPNNYPAGCVATAGTALLQFFNITAAPRFSNVCYVDGTSKTLTTKGINYDWSILPEADASYGSFTATQKDVVDRAVYDMGVCLGMSYEKGGSSSSVSTLANILRSQYGFQDARCVSSISADQYEDLIYSQIRSGAPVVLSIRKGKDGHAVLAVGYGEDIDSTAYTRVFMGWGGHSDAWYALPNVAAYTALSAVVTMIGATPDTLAMRGRVTTESGNAAAYVDVTVDGKTVVTDENGYWGARVTPVEGTLCCSCGGMTKSVTVGAEAANVQSYSASTLAAALPDPVDFTISDADALVVYTNPYSAVRAALREGKILMVLVGYDGCSYCEKLKAQIKEMGSAFSSDFVLLYANTQVNAYGLNDETYTGSPYWGTFDPRIWKLENRWAESNGRLTISHGYSESGTTSDLNSARRKWAVRSARPSSLAISAPDQITIPTALAAKVLFTDGTETFVEDGLTWTVVSGTAATITGGNTLTPRAGASGSVTVRCEGYFWNAPYVVSKTIRIIDGVVAKRLVIDGPDVVDLLKTDGAQYSAKAVLSDGSHVEVPVSWDIVEAKSTNCTISAAGYLSFSRNSYKGESTVRVLARYGAFSAAADVTVWGACVKVDKYTLSDNCAWPGKTVTLTIDKVQWWRHGAWEEPTDDFTGVGVHWYYFVGNVNCYQTTSIGTSRTISFTVPADRNDGSTKIEINLRTSGHSVNDFGLSWMTAYLQYVPSAPSQMVNVTFYGNGGEPDVQTLKYAVGRPYAGFPSVYKNGHYCYWYTAANGGTQITTSSNCLASVTQLYAHWNRKYCYTTYNANGGMGTMSASWFYYDTPANLRANTFTKSGAMFAGWATSPNGPVVYQDGAEILNTSDDYDSLVLYAVWVENGYKIVFDANGGTGEMTPQMCSIGTCSSLKPATFARRGATFAGWSRTPGGNAEFADGGEVCNLATSCGETVTLYAVWNLPNVKKIELTGPDVIDLYDVDSAQFSAVCRLSSGAAADVAPKWTVVETAVTNAVISSDGLVTFPDPGKYSKASRLKVTAECNGVRASKDVDVWGWSVSLSSWTTPQRVVWPGQSMEIVPQTVTWWRHGVTEEPTDNFDGVDFTVSYGWVGNTVTYAADGMSVQIPSSVSEPEGSSCSVCVMAIGSRLGHVVTQYAWNYFTYLASAPSRTIDVTFIANGGKPALQTSKYAVGYTYGKLPEVARKGYYNSWYTASEGGTQITGSSTCLTSVTRLYAQWSPECYYIEYDANGGTGSMSSSWFYYDRPANLRKNGFTKSGAEFVGWATSPDGPVVYNDGAEILNLFSKYAKMTLYAVWSTDCYTISFNANGGTGTMADKKVSAGSCINLPACSFVRTGYAFAGWAESPGGAVKFTDGAQVCDLAASSGGAVVLYAVWQGNTYSVTLSQQSGSGGTSSVTAVYGSPMPSITVPTRSGYVFGGYYTSTGGSGTQYYTAAGDSARTWDRASSTTLYAYWRSAVSGTYVITYSPGAAGTGSQQTDIKTQNVALTLKGAIFTRTGYTQTGWATSDGGSKAYNLGASYTANRAVTLYPFWTKNAVATYKVTLGKNGGTGGDNYVTATYGAAMPTPRTAPKKSGYVFAGYWDTTKEGGKQYYDANMKSVRNWDKACATTIWAKWEKAASVKVTFGKNGGTGGDNYVTATYGKAMPTPRTAPKRSGWTFAGYWDSVAMDANGTPKGKQYYDANMKSVRNWDKTTEAKLWAKWTVRVKLGKNGGTGGDDYVTVTYNQPFPKRTMPKKSGYTFGGYFVSSSKKTGQCYNADGTGTSSMKWSTGGTPTVWALWTKAAGCVELPASPAAPASLTSGLYSGVLADGTGAFWLVLDASEDGSAHTAFLYIASEDGSLTAECTAEEVDGILLLTTEDGETYLLDIATGSLGFGKIFS